MPFALAETTVDVQVTNDIVTVFGTCDGSGPVGLQAGIGLNTVWFGQDDASDVGDYGTFFIASQDGTYTVYAACQGDAAVSKEFCVGAGCTALETPSNPDTNNNGGSSGGGSSCTPKWSCSVWGYCDIVPLYPASSLMSSEGRTDVFDPSLDTNVILREGAFSRLGPAPRRKI